MDEEEVQKKLERIKQERDRHKKAAQEAGQRPSDEEPQTRENPSERRGEPLTEEEIERRMREWRNSTDTTCQSCGICTDEDEEDKDPD